MNQRIVFSIAKEVTVDLLGHREMHVRRASLPVVAPSRVPVCLDGNMRELIGNGPPLFSVQSFRKHGSVGVCRRAAINPARILCVAGYFCCIGTGPMQVFPAIFSVATGSAGIAPLLPLLFPQFVPTDTARGFSRCWVPSPFLEGMQQIERTRGTCGKSSRFHFP